MKNKVGDGRKLICWGMHNGCGFIEEMKPRVKLDAELFSVRECQYTHLVRKIST